VRHIFCPPNKRPSVFQSVCVCPCAYRCVYVGWYVGARAHGDVPMHRHWRHFRRLALQPHHTTAPPPLLLALHSLGLRAPGGPDVPASMLTTDSRIFSTDCTGLQRSELPHPSPVTHALQSKSDEGLADTRCVFVPRLLCVRAFWRMCVCVSIYLSAGYVCLPVYLSVSHCLSVCLSVCPSECLCACAAHLLS
jgi:hypothetical protein